MTRRGHLPHITDPNGAGAPRPRCQMRGCRKVISLREAQVGLCNEHALLAWAHIQRFRHEPDVIEDAIQHYERRIGNLAWSDEQKRQRNNPAASDFRKILDAQTARAEDDLPPLISTEFEDVYYIKMGDLIKIGYSARLYDRLYSYGPTAKVLAHHPGDRAVERDLHRSFRPLLAKGREWYHPGQILLDHIAAVIAEHGAPTCIPDWTAPKEPPRSIRKK